MNEIRFRFYARKYDRLHPVKILHVFPVNGTVRIEVEALQGKPFVGGDKEPIWTKWTFVSREDLFMEGPANDRES